MVGSIGRRAARACLLFGLGGAKNVLLRQTTPDEQSDADGSGKMPGQAPASCKRATKYTTRNCRGKP
eukprot:5554200-Lingulodinium_polyedra.AAC.1